MENPSWTMADRVMLSEKEQRCVALQLEHGFRYHFELPFLEWLKNLSEPRSEDSLTASLPCPPEEAKQFIGALAQESLITVTHVPANEPMPSLQGVVETVGFKKQGFQNSPSQDWQKELVFAASIALLSL